MEEIVSFHKTVRGQFHIEREIPCEDCSASFSDPEGKFHIAVVADGHGDPACFRSKDGSRMACEIAENCLREFASAADGDETGGNEFYRDILHDPRQQRQMLRRLTDSLISRWVDAVMGDLQKNPLTEEEQEICRTYPEKSQNPIHAYGSTLIAALLLPKCLVILQQGDGRCDVFYEDGTVDQPCPWDPFCVGTRTTSLCNENATDHIRYCVLDTEEKPVMACLMGSDGVEDAYRDSETDHGGMHGIMGGVHTFYKDLMCQLSALGMEAFLEFLQNMLPEFSANGRFSHAGSGDDVSVAGLVNLNLVQEHSEQFEKDVHLYSLEEELFWKEEEIRGRTRKHEILLKRFHAAVEATKAAREALNLEQQKLSSVCAEKENCLKAEQRLQEELLKYQQESSDMQSKAESGDTDGSLVSSCLNVLQMSAKEFLERITQGTLQKKAAYEKAKQSTAEANDRVEAMQECCLKNENALSAALESEKQAQAVFGEYDAAFQVLENERQEILNQISEQSGG